MSQAVTLSNRFALGSGVTAGLCVALLAGTARAQLLPGEQCLHMTYSSSAKVVGNAVLDIASADLDGDGDVDLLTADTYTGMIRMLLNNGSGVFNQQNINPGVNPAALALADVDGDGDPDLFIGHSGGLRWLRNDGAAHFSAAATFAFPPNEANANAVRVADVNEDGVLDVLLAFTSHPSTAGLTGGLWVLLGDGAGGFQPLPTTDLPLYPHEVALTDVDGDGHLDVVDLGGYISASAVGILSGRGDGTFASALPSFAVGIYAGGLAVGDFDGDGDADIATGFKYNLSVRLNDGIGHFTLAQSVTTGAYVKGIAAGDLDRDGDLDLLATSGSASMIRLLTNDGNGNFALTASIPASIQCYSVLLADTNGDGYLDAWAGDVTTGQLFSGASHCVVARYGAAKVNSTGALPWMTASGSTAVSGAGFVAAATKLLPTQPALVVVGFAPFAQPMLGGLLLVAPPSIFVPAVTDAGSGDPNLSDATLTLPISGAQLGLGGVGTRVYLQVLSGDPQHPDGSMASLTDGVRFEIVP